MSAEVLLVLEHLVEIHRWETLPALELAFCVLIERRVSGSVTPMVLPQDRSVDVEVCAIRRSEDGVGSSVVGKWSSKNVRQSAYISFASSSMTSPSARSIQAQLFSFHREGRPDQVTKSCEVFIRPNLQFLVPDSTLYKYWHITQTCGDWQVADIKCPFVHVCTARQTADFDGKSNFLVHYTRYSDELKPLNGSSNSSYPVELVFLAPNPFEKMACFGYQAVP
ncbi:hypothetical protein C8F04DRAFT_1234357 [Mycena alexandri]|uniref:Uncharacterized protein n=1 Tax=Mycena alexandri TaxID=1745969 RepID=A0AAD6X0H0_9AGAR|nr:hypothetical protein C8F04DRAFT_1234357 [Mycena alexandri]